MNLISLALAVALQARPSVVIVSYRIAAPPGSVISYAGETYPVGKSGSIELVAEPGTATVALGEMQFNLPQSGPTDDFGSVTVSLIPASQSYKLGLEPHKATRSRAAR